MAENLLELEEMRSSEDQTRFVGSRIGVISLVAAAVLVLSACASGDKQPPTPPATSASPSSAPTTERVVGPLTPADAQARRHLHAGGAPGHQTPARQRLWRARRQAVEGVDHG